MLHRANLRAIAQACDAPPQVVQAVTQANVAVPDTLSTVLHTVEALPAADLIAVANAIAAQSQ